MKSQLAKRVQNVATQYTILTTAYIQSWLSFRCVPNLTQRLYKLIWLKFLLDDNNRAQMSLLPKNLQVLHTLLEEYQTYKEGFVRNMVFLPGEQSIVGQDFKTLGSWRHFETGADSLIPSCPRRQPQTGFGPDIFHHRHIRPDWPRCSLNRRGPARPHRRHHGTPHRLLHPQWGRDCLLRHQVLHVPQNHQGSLGREENSWSTSLLSLSNKDLCYKKILSTLQDLTNVTL